MSNIDRMYEEAWNLYFMERWTDSIAVLQKILELDSRQANALSFISVILVVQKLDLEHKEAKKYSDQALSIDPNNWLAYTARGVSLDFQHKYSEARKEHEQAVRFSPDSWFARSRSALSLSSMGQESAALIEFNTLLATNPDCFYAYFHKGTVLRRQEKNDAAIEAYSKAIDLKRNFVSAYIRRADTTVDLKKYREALNDYTKAVDINPDQSYALFRRAWCLEGLKMEDEAIRAYSHYIQKNGIQQSSAALNNRGTLYKNRGDTTKALADFEQAIQSDPQNKHPWANRGDLKILQGDLSGAIQDFKQSILLAPHFSYSMEGLHKAYLKKGDHPKALAVTAHLRQVEPRPKWTYEDKDTQYFSNTVYNHFQQVIVPALQKNNERFVDYWEARMVWGARQSQSIYQGTSSIVHEGKFGAGYVLLAEKNIWIVTIGELSKKFAKSTGLLGKLFLAALRNLDMTSTEKKDVILCVPHSDIQSVNLKEGVFSVGIGADQWQIYPWFSDVDQSLLAALNLARRDQVAELWLPLVSPPASTPPIAPPEDIYSQIEKLKKLLDMQALSQQQYDSKVQELLNRL